MSIIWKIIVLIGVVLLIEIWRELHTFRMTHYHMCTPRLSQTDKAWNVLFVSDLHNCTYGKQNRRLLKAMAEEKPDLILVGGDILVGDERHSTEVAEQFLRDCSKIAPVYCGRGNHEQRLSHDYYRAYQARVQSDRIHFLENESVTVAWEGNEIRITAFELPQDCYTRFQGRVIELSEIEECVGKASKEQFQVLLAHHPMHVEAYEKWGADLVLSGHLHGGIVRIPFWRGAITPQAFLFPKYSGGQYHVGSTTLVVSKGLGTHTIPIRLFNEPEVVVLHIKGK